MTTRAKCLVGLASLTLVALIGIALRISATPAEADSPPEASGFGVGTVATSAEHESGSQANRDETESLPGRSPSLPRRVAREGLPNLISRVRGRCVDLRGRPVAGVRLLIESCYSGRTAVEALEDGVGWTTNSAGEFDAAFAPAKLRVHDVTLLHPGFVTLIDRYVRVEAGETHEFGTIEFPVGRILNGQLVDRHGHRTRPLETPAALTFVRAYERPLNTGFRPRDQFEADVDPLGVVSAAELIPYGAYELNARGFDLLDPDSEVRIGSALSEVPVPSFAEDDYVRLRGFVVDPTQRGIARADVWLIRSENSGTAQVSTVSDRHGAFELRVRSDSSLASQTNFRIRVAAAGYETDTSERTFRWGDSGIRVQPRPLLTARLWIRSEEDGEPVAGAFVSTPRSRRADRLSHANSLALEIALQQPTGPDGLKVLEGLLPRSYSIHVVPPIASGLAQAWFDVEITRGAPLDRVLSIPRAVTQRVIVLDRSGHPIPDAKILAFDLSDHFTRDPSPEELLGLNAHPDAILSLSGGSTNSDGELVLHVRDGPGLALWVDPYPGREFVASSPERPFVVRDVELGEEPIRVSLP